MWCGVKDKPLKVENYEDLLEKINKLENDNNDLRKRLEKADTQWSSNIDAFVEQWYEDNNEEIDIGVVDFKFFKIDIMPDYLEKHIYKKVLKIVFSFLNSSLAPKVSGEDK